jgi:hypothetical protein
VVRALVSLVPGDQVTITYVDPLLPLPVRRQELFSKYCFDCSCSRCLAEQAVLLGASLEGSLPVSDHGQQQASRQDLDVAATSAAAAARAAATAGLRLHEAVESAQELMQQGRIQQATTAVEPLLWHLLQPVLTFGGMHATPASSQVTAIEPDPATADSAGAGGGMGWYGSAWSQPAVVIACVFLSAAYQQLAAAGCSQPREASPYKEAHPGRRPSQEGCRALAARSASYSLLAVGLLTEWLLQGEPWAVHVPHATCQQ